MKNLMRVLYIGDRTSLDFQSARRRLTASVRQDECEVLEEADIASALAAIARLRQEVIPAPDLVLLPQNRSGDLAVSDIDSLRRLAPLATIVVLLGNWCEGEGRSGRPVPGVVRVPWHRFGPEWQRHLDGWRHSRCSPWELPATLSDDELLLWRSELFRHQYDQDLASLSIVLGRSGKRDDEWLSSVCQAAGWSVVEHVGQHDEVFDSPSVGIWEANLLDAEACSGLKRFARSLHPAPVIAVAGFPRPEDDGLVRAAGATSLLAKPLAIEDLAAEVAWLLSEQSVVAEKS